MIMFHHLINYQKHNYHPKRNSTPNFMTKILVMMITNMQLKSGIHLNVKQ